MTTYNCPRCGEPSPPERCPACGRGPVPQLARLSELDTVLSFMPATLRSRAAVEAERRETLDALVAIAGDYRTGRAPTAAQQTAPHTPPTGAPVPVGAMPPSGSMPQAGAPISAGPTAPGPATPPAALPVPERGEVATRTAQTTLLGLGGILVAAAIIIFTAVAWQSMGDAGRLATLTAFTGVLLATPAVLIRFRLWATAETFAALAALALWCSALAGHYQYLPAGAALSAEAVGTWSAVVLAALTIYRAAIPATAAGWALLPLAAIGSAFAAAGPIRIAAPLMLATAAVLAAAAFTVARRPGRYARSDQWAARLLLCAAVIEAFLAGLRVAFGLSGAVVPIVAAGIAFLAAANLLATLYARRAGATSATLLIAAATTGALTVCTWVLAFRSTELELAVPSIALFVAVMTALLTLDDRRDPAVVTAAVAGTTALAAFAVVAFGAPDLTAYLVATVAIGLASLLLPDPLGPAVRRAAHLAGLGTAAAASLIALSALPAIWWAEDAPWLTWETPIVLGVLALGAIVLPRRFRLDFLALCLTFAVVAASGLLWQQAHNAVPAWGLTVCALIGLTLALTSDTVGGRCAGWAALTAWIPSTAGAINAASLDTPEQAIELGLVVAAALMLLTAAGAPRRSRPDRVLGAILAHVLAGFAIGWWLLFEWIDWGWSGSSADQLLPLAIGVYTLALAGVALMVPVLKGPYATAALCTGTAAWWTLLVSEGIETLEAYTVLPAAVVFALGLWRLERRPGTGSWAALSLPIAVGIGPSLLLALGADDPARRAGVAAAGVAVVIAGVGRRWQAPLVLGSITLLALTVNELSLVWSLIPKWIPLALGGAVLIGAGATLEQRRKDMARLGRAVKSMR